MSTVHANSHRFTISVLPFLSAQASTRQVFLAPGELKAFAAEVILPPECVGEISISDTISSGATFQITLPNAGHRWFTPITPTGQPAPGGQVRFMELFDPGNIILIREGSGLEPVAPKFFAGYILSRRHMADAESGRSDLIVAGGGMEASVKNQIVYIDFENRESQAGLLQPAQTIAASPAARLIGAINNIVSVIREMNDPALMVRQLLTVLTTQFLAGGRYGGFPFATLFDITTGITKTTYTKAFIHALNWMSQPQFGARISYWDMLQTLATPPLYELFVSQDNNPVYIDETTALPRPNEGPVLGTVVFRKTPFLFMADAPPPGANPNPALFYVLPESKIKKPDLTKSIDDIFSGVHVGLGILDTTAGLAINPVTYTPALVEKFGQRVLPVTLEGVGFPEQGNSDESPLKSNLLLIQNLLADVFGQAPGSPMPAERALSGEIQIHYSGRAVPDRYGNTGGVTKGKILQIVPDAPNPPGRVLKMYDSLYYIDGVRTTFSPERGTVDQVLIVKWGRERSRNPKEFATVMQEVG